MVYRRGDLEKKLGDPRKVASCRRWKMTIGNPSLVLAGVLSAWR